MCQNPITIKDPNNPYNTINVKCGKCILCRRRKCRDWAIKLIKESQYHKKMCMLTLTFRLKFLLKPEIKELTKYHQKIKNGEIIKWKTKHQTIVGPHYITDVRKTKWLISLFMKKLRKEFTTKKNCWISYFAVGEHGTQNTHRAHWHILIFGLDKNDFKATQEGVSKKNKPIYRSTLLDMLWSYKKLNIGRTTISDVTASTIKYVANYTMKKMYKGKNTYPTTMQFSNQAKIGYKWCRRYHKELRKGVLMDEDKAKYPVPKSFYKELLRYTNSEFDNTMIETATILETIKEETIKKLNEKGLLSKNEMKKKAHRLEERYKKMERDTEI